MCAPAGPTIRTAFPGEARAQPTPREGHRVAGKEDWVGYWVGREKEAEEESPQAQRKQQEPRFRRVSSLKEDCCLPGAREPAQTRARTQAWGLRSLKEAGFVATGRLPACSNQEPGGPPTADPRPLTAHGARELIPVQVAQDTGAQPFLSSSYAQHVRLAQSSLSTEKFLLNVKKKTPT